MHSSIVSASLGLATAMAWGAGDFCGGLATRRAKVCGVVIGSHVSGAVLFVVLAAAFREPAPALRNLAACGAAGLCGSIGLLALYRALSTGRMGIAAPVSGVLSAAVPVAVGALLQGRPGGFKLTGFLLALFAVWLVSRTEDGSSDCVISVSPSPPASASGSSSSSSAGRARARSSGRWRRRAWRRCAR